MRYERVPYRQEGVKLVKTANWLTGKEVMVPSPDAPITPLENFKLAVSHQTPCWMPNSTSDFIQLQSQKLAGDEMKCPPWGSPDRQDFTDEFGVLWEYVPEAGGAIVKPGWDPILTDITQWERQVKFPDYRNMDFSTYARYFNENLLNPDLVLQVNLRQGCTERMVALTGSYSESMLMMAEEPDACRDYFNAFAEWYCGFIDHIASFYPVDFFSYQDDWGTERDTFFSEAMMEYQLLDATRRIVDHVHSKGAVFMLHSCGKIERFLKYMIDMKVDLLQIQARANDIPKMMEEHGHEIGLNATIEGIAPNATDEEYASALHATVERYGKQGGCYMTVGFGDDQKSWERIFELYCHSREFYDMEREALALT